MWASDHRRAVCHFKTRWSMVLKTSRYWLVFAAGLIGPTALAADADNGKRLAERWCASCHVVTPDQKTANTDSRRSRQLRRRSDFMRKSWLSSCWSRTRRCRTWR